MSKEYVFKFKRAFSKFWNSNNSPILESGEPGVDLDTGKLKIGNGFNKWKDLPYVGQFLEVKELPPIDQANEDIIYFYKDMMFKFNKDMGKYTNIINPTSLEWIILE